MKKYKKSPLHNVNSKQLAKLLKILNTKSYRNGLNITTDEKQKLDYINY